MRRARTAGIALLVTLLGLLAPVPAEASVEAGPAAYDRTIGAADCGLLGRAFRRGQGCSRERCVAGATPFRKTYGAEACALKGQPKGFGFVATVPVEQCEELGRRWIAQVNYCASEPDRSRPLRYDAPQCTGGASVYVPLREEEGYYDECLTPERVVELSATAAATGTTLQQLVEAGSLVQCWHRPRTSYVDGTCVSDPAAPLAAGGTLLIGDSLSWRASDELADIAPRLTVDGEPARPATVLAARLAAYAAGHEPPQGLIVELGTVPAPGFRRRDLVRAVREVPSTTRVMLVLPHFEVRTDPVVASPQSRAVGAWMRALARARPRTCLADWPAYVATHRGVLADGVHTTHPAERSWARWLTAQWKRC